MQVRGQQQAMATKWWGVGVGALLLLLLCNRAAPVLGMPPSDGDEDGEQPPPPPPPANQTIAPIPKPAAQLPAGKKYIRPKYLGTDPDHLEPSPCGMLWHDSTMHQPPPGVAISWFPPALRDVVPYRKAVNNPCAWVVFRDQLLTTSVQQLQAAIMSILQHLAAVALHPTCRLDSLERLEQYYGMKPAAAKKVHNQSPFTHPLLVARAMYPDLGEPVCMPYNHSSIAGSRGLGLWVEGKYLRMHVGRVESQARLGAAATRRPGRPPNKKAKEVDGAHSKMYVHQFLCWAFHGPPPNCEWFPSSSSAMQVGHVCGCADCLNPMHLSWVTAKENGRAKKFHAKPGNRGKPVPESDDSDEPPSDGGGGGGAGPSNPKRSRRQGQ